MFFFSDFYEIFDDGESGDIVGGNNLYSIIYNDKRNIVNNLNIVTRSKYTKNIKIPKFSSNELINIFNHIKVGLSLLSNPPLNII